MSQPKKKKDKRVLRHWLLPALSFCSLFECIIGGSSATAWPVDQLSVVDLTLGTGRLAASSQLIRLSGCRPHQPTSNGSRWSKARAWALWQGFGSGGEVPACTRRLTDDNALPRGYTDTLQCEADSLRYCLKTRWWRICGWCFNTPHGRSSIASISSPYSVSFYVTEQLGLD